MWTFVQYMHFELLVEFGTLARRRMYAINPSIQGARRLNASFQPLGPVATLTWPGSRLTGTCRRETALLNLSDCILHGIAFLCLDLCSKRCNNAVLEASFIIHSPRFPGYSENLFTPILYRIIFGCFSFFFLFISLSDPPLCYTYIHILTAALENPTRAFLILSTSLSILCR
jgi:hypothetical protein